MIRKLFFLILLAVPVFATEPKVIPLWPGAAPGSENWNYEEGVPQDASHPITNVTRPTLTAYFPDPSLATGTAVIICPGGGFRELWVSHEGTDLARWLNSIGVAAFILKYRVMRTGDSDANNSAIMAERRKIVVPLAIADGQQAVRLVRAHASEWGVSKDRIGILGFSAGGYVAAAVALHHDADSRPNFAAPIYPGTPDDVTAPADAPPLFLVHADDDKIVPPLDHSIRLYAAWKKLGIPAELHIYSAGGHGFGTRKISLPAGTWTDRFRDWLDVQGLLKRPQS
jgi:acetyl esterase/lipase